MPTDPIPLLLAAGATAGDLSFLFKTIPLWPLLAACLVGLFLALSGRSATDPHGHDHHGGHGDDPHRHDAHAHDSHGGHGHAAHTHGSHGQAGNSAGGGLRALCDKVVIAGAAASAVLSVMLWLSTGAPAGTHPAQHQDGAKAATGAAHVDEHLESPANGDAHGGGHATGAHDGDGQGGHATWHYVAHIFQWISLGEVRGEQRWIDVNYYIDPLTIVMLLVVSVIATFIILYATGYMRDHHGHKERGYERFFAFLALFVFSMLMLVLAGNFALLYLGWELVGLCSYLLIGFYYPKPAAAAAAKKAFLVNRIGDLGFALGIFSIYQFITPHLQAGENPLDYAVVFKYAAAGVFSEGQLTQIGLLLLCGALGKSAQFPLYVWLPDAMEGPTPVSALIHAATMVTAGVYMIARCSPLFVGSPLTMDVILYVGVIGAVLAATMALAQYDMKRIMAYSTMSQLAFMFVALACGAASSAIFHLYTHAFFKALLFLTAGSVMHAMGNIIDLRQFSGLRRVLPQTYLLCLVGCLALAGFPLLAGFWSKDEIVHAAFASDMGKRHPWLFWVMLGTAGLTAFYTFRMFFLCFHGPLRTPREAGEHIHESPPRMILPLVPLAAGAVLAGFVGVSLKFSLGESFLGFLKPHGAFHHYLHQSSLIDGPHHSGDIWIAYLSVLVGLAGIGLAWLVYGRAPVTDPVRGALGPAWSLLNHKYWVDEIYAAIFVRPLRKLGDLCFAADRNGIDGLVWFTTAVPRLAGLSLQLFQRGALQGYALSMALGLAALLGIAMLLIRGAGS